MSREDANLAIAIIGLFIAVIATWTSVYAIRRDRAELRVTAEDAAAGNRYLIVVNTGMRPVRIERVLVRWWRLLPRLSKTMALNAYVVLPTGAEQPIPTVVEPAGAITLHYAAAEYSEVVRERRHDIVIEDAAGRKYPIRAAPVFRFGPDGF